MSWDTSLLTTVRYTIGDITVPYRYSDYQIQQAILVATKFVQGDVTFPLNYVVVLGSGGYISPDPTLSNGCNPDAQTLIALRAAALLTDGDARKMAGRDGAKAMLGPSFIDVAHGPALKSLLKDGPISAYDEALWGYRYNNAVGAYKVILSPARLAYAPSYNDVGFGGCPSSPTLPCLTVEDNGDETATVTIGCTVDGSENTFEISGSWIPVHSISGNGNFQFESGVGNYYGRVVSRINGASGISDTVSFTISPEEPALISFELQDLQDGSGLSVLFAFTLAQASGYVNYGTSLTGPFNNVLLSGGFDGTKYIPSGNYYAQWVVDNQGAQISGVEPFSVTLFNPTIEGTDGGLGDLRVSSVDVLTEAHHYVQISRHNANTWQEIHNYTGSADAVYFSYPPVLGSVDLRLRSVRGPYTIYSAIDSLNITFPSPSLDIDDSGNGSSILFNITSSVRNDPNRFQYKATVSPTWINGPVASGNFTSSVSGLAPTVSYHGRIQSNFGGVVQYSTPVSFTIASTGFDPPTLSVTNRGSGSIVDFVVTGGEATADNTIQYKLSVDSIWTNGDTFTGPFTDDLVLTEANYDFRIRSVYLGDTLYSNEENVTIEEDEPPVGLMDMPISDVNMRAITNAAHPYWDTGLYLEYSEKAGDCLMVLGTRVNYSLNAERIRCSASGDPYEGLATSTELSNGLKHAWVRYGQLYSGYKVTHPDSLVGSYQASYNLKTDDWMLHTGLNYPPDTDQVAAYLPACTGVGDPIAAPGSVAGIKITEEECLSLSKDRFVEMAAGTLRNHFKEDTVWFDEVGYVAGQWDIQVDRFIDLKARFHDVGARIGLNLGGNNLTAAFPFAPNLFSQLPQMCDYFTQEGPWPRTAGADGLSTRTQDNTIRLINNYRGLMDSGTSIIFIPTSAEQDNNIHNIASIVETDGGTRLLVTFTSPAYIFPHGGYAVERMILSELTASVDGLEEYAWTPVEVVGNPSQVKLYVRFTTLSAIKTAQGIVGTINTTGGKMEDLQASVRLNAGFAMMIRRPGDGLFVSQGPTTDEGLAGGGVSSNPDCWWYWPQQFGEPIADYVIASTGAGGIVTQMYRDFDNGRVTVYPSGGYVVLS